MERDSIVLFKLKYIIIIKNIFQGKFPKDDLWGQFSEDNISETVYYELFLENIFSMKNLSEIIF